MHESLEQRIEELVMSAFHRGQMAMAPMTSPRRADELHAEVWNELQDLLREMEK